MREVADRVVVMYAGKIVEEANASELFSAPRHPYTCGLIKSIPKLAGYEEKLYTIEGTVPMLDQLPVGCRFQNRCPNAFATCIEREPALLEEKSGHKLACFNPM